MVFKLLILILTLTTSHALTEKNFNFKDPFRKLVYKLEKSIQQKLPIIKSSKSEPISVPTPEIKLTIRGVVNSANQPTAIIEYQREVLFIGVGFRNKDFSVTAISDNEIRLINHNSKRAEIKKL